MTARRLPRLACLAGAVLLAMGGCSLWGPEGGPGGVGLAAPTASATPAPVDALLGADGVQRVEVTVGDDLRFTPEQVRAQVGIVEFTFRNTGTVPHDARFEIGSATPGTGNLNGGQTQTVQVSVDRAGSFPFPCLYHISSGMRGTLEVTGSL